MLYFSTRGGSPAVSSAQAVVDGLAPDGGLYIMAASDDSVVYLGLKEGIRPEEDVRVSVALRDEVGSVYTLKERT